MPARSALASPVAFVVLSAMRSGSNNLQDALARHPEIECGGELFNPEHLQLRGRVYRGTGVAARLFAAAGVVKRRWPDAVVRLARSGRGKPLFGFRVFGNHVDRLQLVPYLDSLHARGARFIHLVRRDTFDQALSLVRARDTGVWKRTAGSRSSEPRVDAAVAADRVAAAAAELHAHKLVAARVARRLGALLVDFDDYLADERSYERIQTFLGVRERLPLRHANVRTPPIDGEAYRRLREEVARLGAPMRFEADSDRDAPRRAR